MYRDRTNVTEKIDSRLIKANGLAGMALNVIITAVMILYTLFGLKSNHERVTGLRGKINWWCKLIYTYSKRIFMLSP